MTSRSAAKPRSLHLPNLSPKCLACLGAGWLRQLWSRFSSWCRAFLMRTSHFQVPKCRCASKHNHFQGRAWYMFLMFSPSWTVSRSWQIWLLGVGSLVCVGWCWLISVDLHWAYRVFLRCFTTSLKGAWGQLSDMACWVLEVAIGISFFGKRSDILEDLKPEPILLHIGWVFCQSNLLYKLQLEAALCHAVKPFFWLVIELTYNS